MAKDRCTQTRLSARNQKRIAASFFPNETGASINACTQGKKGRQKQKKNSIPREQKPVYTAFERASPSIFQSSTWRAGIKKEQRPIGDITDITACRYGHRGRGNACACVCIVTKLTERGSVSSAAHSDGTTRDALTPSSIIVQTRRQFHGLILVNY